MPEFADIYVITKERNCKVVHGFLEAFMPDRIESAVDYPVPQLSDDPLLVLSSSKDLIEYACKNKLEEYAVYWNALGDKKPEHAMVFFLSDGSIIFGLSTDATNEEYAIDLLSRLKAHLSSTLGYQGWEECPYSASYLEFENEVLKREL